MESDKQVLQLMQEEILDLKSSQQANQIAAFFVLFWLTLEWLDRKIRLIRKGVNAISKPLDLDGLLAKGVISKEEYDLLKDRREDAAHRDS